MSNQFDEALRKSEARAQALLNAIPDMMFRLHVDGTYLEFKAAQSELVMPAKHIIGSNIADSPLPDNMIQETMRFVQLAVSTGEVQIYEYELDLPDGRHSYEGRFFKSGSDEAMAIVRDITERKRVEGELHYRLEFEALLGHISTTFINLPPKEIDKGINNALQRIAEFVGAARSSVFLFSNNLKFLTNSHEWCIDPNDSQIALLKNIPAETFGSHLTTLKRFDPVILRSPDDLPADAHGEREWIKEHGFRALLFAPIIYENVLYGALGFYGAVNQNVNWPPEFISLLKFAADIFVNALERKRTEVKLRQYYDQLEETVKERTAKLNIANAELTQYAYVVSHDLKAPLRAINSYADFLREDLEGTLDEEQEEYLDGLGEAVQEAEQLVNDLLTLSRIGRQNIAIEQIEIGSFLAELLTRLELPAEIEIFMAEEWPALETQPTLLRQILQNLILNGIKFNTSRPKHLELGWLPAPQEHIELFVRDNGIGIAPRLQEKIFQVFQRLHTSDEYEGTGIGLAIVKKASQTLGGSVRVESEVGVGSTFFVRLPLS